MVRSDEILALYPEPIRALADEVRALVAATLPPAVERPYAGSQAIGFHDPAGGHLCNLFLFDDRVELSFEYGARLPDPDNILQGQHMKQVRYLALRPGSEVPRAAIERLLLAALHHGTLRKATRGRQM